MRTPLVIGNWKMHGTVAEARGLATGIRDGLKRPRGVQVAVCPPFTALPAVSEILAGSPIQVGAQNCHHEPSGAHTGEIAVPMLAELGCRWILAGHSERRKEMGETDEQIKLKVRAVLSHDLTPVLCVGETADERRQGLTFTTVEGQLRAGLAGLSGEQIAKTVLAYEPVWAIGTGKTATAAQAQEAHHHIRGRLRQWFGADAAEKCHVIYGGSVKPDNIAELMREPDVDGGLVGGASLEVRSFVDIVTNSRPATV